MAWVPFIFILIGLGCMGLWASATSPYIPDQEYLDCAAEGEPPRGLPESQKSLSFWASIGFIVTGILIAVFVFGPGLTRIIFS